MKKEKNKKPRTLEEILNILDDYFQEAGSNVEDRLKRIEEVKGYTEFNTRLTKLSDEEKLDYVYCNEGYPLSDQQRETLNGCRNQEKKDYYIEMWATSTYIRKCAWIDYLTGNTTEKPTMYSIATAA